MPFFLKDGYLTWESNFFVGVDGDVKGTPSASLVNICYGLQPFPYKSGMYVAANIGMELDMKETVSFSPLIKDGERILGGFLSLEVFAYSCVWSLRALIMLFAPCLTLVLIGLMQICCVRLSK